MKVGDKVKLLTNEYSVCFGVPKYSTGVITDVWEEIANVEFNYLVLGIPINKLEVIVESDTAPEGFAPVEPGVTYFNCEFSADKKFYKLNSEAASSTGSMRFNSGKTQTSEIDPQFLLGIGEVMTKARDKYERGNWMLGNNWSVPYESMMRHLMQFQQGIEVDSESGKDHLLHAATNIMILYYYSKNFPQFDDRLFKKDKK